MVIIGQMQTFPCSWVDIRDFSWNAEASLAGFWKVVVYWRSPSPIFWVNVLFMFRWVCLKLCFQRVCALAEWDSCSNPLLEPFCLLVGSCLPSTSVMPTSKRIVSHCFGEDAAAKDCLCQWAERPQIQVFISLSQFALCFDMMIPSWGQPVWPLQSLLSQIDTGRLSWFVGNFLWYQSFGLGNSCLTLHDVLCRFVYLNYVKAMS